MLIRAATPDDCAALAALDALGNPSPWSPAQFQTALDNRHDTVKLMEDNGHITGFIVWQTVFDESELHLIATAPAYRRRGIAAQLLAEWFQTTSIQHVQRLLLEVRAGNEAAQALYRKHGFSECGRRKNYYRLPEGGSEDALWMERLC